MRALVLAALLMVSACGQSAAPAPGAEPTGDAAQVLSRLPLIDACLALSPATRTVTIDPQSSTQLRLSGAEQTVDCVLPNEDADPALATILPALDEPPADALIFVRGPGENPGGECYEAPEVRDANGSVVGWILDPEGC